MNLKEEMKSIRKDKYVDKCKRLPKFIFSLLLIYFKNIRLCKIIIITLHCWVFKICPCKMYDTDSRREEKGNRAM